MVTIQWLLHSTVKITVDETVIYVNPTLVLRDQIKDADYVMITHGNDDHIKTIIQSGRDAKIIANLEICAFL